MSPALRAILFGESRVNLFQKSQDFDNAIWAKGGVVAVVANATAAPDGSLSADLIPAQASSTEHSVSQSIQVLGSTAYTFSCYWKASGQTKLALREGTSTGAYAAWDVSASGSVIGSSGMTARISDVGGGWFRAEATWNGSSAGAKSMKWYIMDAAYTGTAPNSYVWTGDGTAGLYAWGAQAEIGSVATAYMPTP